MVTALLGPAWQEAVKDATPARSYWRLLLDLGAAGVLPCRIVENPKREAVEKAPTHLIFHTPVTGGDGVKIGALWPHRNDATGAEYLTGNLELGRLGLVELKGGAKVDFRLVGERLGVRFSETRERMSEKSPTHQLWRMSQRSRVKAAAAPASVPATSTEESISEEFSEEELLEISEDDAAAR